MNELTVDQLTPEQKYNELSTLAALAYLRILDHTNGAGTMLLYTPEAMARLIAPRHFATGDIMLTIVAEWIAVGIVTVEQKDAGRFLRFEKIDGAS